VPRSGSSVSLGHSLSGALAVAAMLLALITQVTTGLVGDDEIAFTGPLNRYISTDLGLAATSWHKGVGQWLLVGLIALHVCAIAFYFFVRRNNLVGPMVHGDKSLPDGAQEAAPLASRDTAGSRLLALAVLGACAGAVTLMVRLAS